MCPIEKAKFDFQLKKNYFLTDNCYIILFAQT